MVWALGLMSPDSRGPATEGLLLCPLGKHRVSQCNAQSLENRKFVGLWQQPVIQFHCLIAGV